MGKGLNSSPASKERSHLENRCFLCQRTEETIDYLLLYCGKTRVLWELFFSFFGVKLGLSYLN